jgi:DDE superfamily endonuclease
MTQVNVLFITITINTNIMMHDNNSDVELVYRMVLSDSDDNDNQLLNPELIHLLLLYLTIIDGYRSKYKVRDRIEWEPHAEKLLNEGAFNVMYRMSYEAFNKICDYLDPIIAVDAEMSQLRTGTGVNATKIIVASFIRWISGGAHHNIRTVGGLSQASFYRLMWRCAKAILDCKELDYSFPQTEEEIQTAANNFRSLSTNNFMNGCVGVMDGLLLRIRIPPNTEVGNVKSFFSGHYHAYGINIQAACDHRCRFTEVCVSSPGGHNDIIAYRKSSLPKLIERLPIGKYMIGDIAYVCSEHLLTPFSGESRKDPNKDTFNFYVSQLRIRIEMAFGLLTTKWRILRSPLQVKVDNVGTIFLAITRLHNYCINERVYDKSEIINIVNNTTTTPLTSNNSRTNNTPPPNSNSSNNISTNIITTSNTPTPTQEEPPPVVLVERPYLPSDVTTSTIAGHSMLRDIILQQIVQHGLSCPQYNLERNLADRGRHGHI